MIAKRTGPDMAEEKDLIGKRIGNYYLIEKIGSGSSGTVYRAHHVHLIDRIVALKVLHIHLSVSEGGQFIREFQILARLQHPHILSVLDIDFDGDMAYLVSEYALGVFHKRREIVR